MFTWQKRTPHHGLMVSELKNGAKLTNSWQQRTPTALCCTHVKPHILINRRIATLSSSSFHLLQVHTQVASRSVQLFLSDAWLVEEVAHAVSLKLTGGSFGLG